MKTRHYYAYVPSRPDTNMFEELMDLRWKRGKLLPGRLVIYKSDKRLPLPVIETYFVTEEEGEQRRSAEHCTFDEASRAYGRKRLRQMVLDADANRSTTKHLTHGGCDADTRA